MYASAAGRSAAPSGRANEVTDRALYIDGNALQPVGALTSDCWQYEWKETRPDGGAHADSLRIRAPVLAASPGAGIVVTTPIAGREGPRG